MKNLVKLFGIIVIVTVVGFSMASCEDFMSAVDTMTAIDFINNSSVAVTVYTDSYGTFTLSARGGSRRINSSSGFVNFDWSPRTVRMNSVTSSVTFYD